jgi:2-hydroxychromene-2-carboxylate isomerase
MAAIELISMRAMYLASIRVAVCGAFTLLSLPALAADAGTRPDVASAAAARAGTQQQTLKERLGDKASDEQRVDNCKVPPERRGPKIRPDDCNHEPNSPTGAQPR